MAASKWQHQRPKSDHGQSSGSKQCSMKLESCIISTWYEQFVRMMVLQWWFNDVTIMIIYYIQSWWDFMLLSTYCATGAFCQTFQGTTDYTCTVQCLAVVLTAVPNTETQEVAPHGEERRKQLQKIYEKNTTRISHLIYHLSFLTALLIGTNLKGWPFSVWVYLLGANPSYSYLGKAKPKRTKKKQPVSVGVQAGGDVAVSRLDASVQTDPYEPRLDHQTECLSMRPLALIIIIFWFLDPWTFSGVGPILGDPHLFVLWLVRSYQDVQSEIFMPIQRRAREDAERTRVWAQEGDGGKP